MGADQQKSNSQSHFLFSLINSTHSGVAYACHTHVQHNTDFGDAQSTTERNSSTRNSSTPDTATSQLLAVRCESFRQRTEKSHAIFERMQLHVFTRDIRNFWEWRSGGIWSLRDFFGVSSGVGQLLKVFQKFYRSWC